MTKGQRLVVLWRKQRLLLTREGSVTFRRTPSEKDYAELSRRIDSFASRVKAGRA